MCGVNDQPMAEGVCAVGCLIGLCSLFVGDTVMAAICLFGVMVGQILMFGDKLEKQQRDLKRMYDK